MSFVIPVENSTAYDSIPRNRQLGHTIPYRCNKPSRSLVVDWKGDCFVCSCEAWLPIRVGTITDFDQLADIWASTTARALQADCDQGLYTHCAVDRCGIMTGDIQVEKYTVSINIDPSCNLSCPSCRQDVIMITSGAEYEQQLAWVTHLVRLLETTDLPCHIIMSGNGDPLASSIMRPLLHRFRPGPGQTIRLYTNGLLLQKQLTDNPVVAHITEYFVSVDAGSAEVYHQVRRGGRWDRLMRNFDFLQSLALTHQAQVLLLFVLQRDNCQDMELFIQLCRRYGFRGWINRVENWGTYGAQGRDFPEHDVIGNRDHPLHAETLASLRDVYARYHGHQIKFESSLQRLAKDKIPTW